MRLALRRVEAFDSLVGSGTEELSLSLALTLKHSLYQFRKSCQNSGLLQLHRHFFIMIYEYKLINLTDLKVSFLTCLNFPHFSLN